MSKNKRIKKSNIGRWLVILSYIISLLSVFIYVFKFFYPYHITVAIIVYLSNWGVFFLGGYLIGKKYSTHLKRYKKFIIFTIIAFVVIYLIYVLLPIGKVEFLGMTKAELSKQIETDLKDVEIITQGMDDTISKIEKNKEIFKATSLDELSEEDKKTVLELWAEYLDHQVALNMLIKEYRYFYQINYITNKELHSKAFLIGYSSFLKSYESGIRMIDLTINNPLFETILDDENKEYGISKGMYAELKWNVLHVNDVIRVVSGYNNYKFLYPQFIKYNLTINKPILFNDIEDSYKFIMEKLGEKSAVWFPSNAVDIFKEQTYTIWFPVQKNTANFMGKTRTTTRHSNYITKKQILEMKKVMLPGDIMVQRRNWYLTNIGIPGFWPHAAIYLGFPSELEEFFANEEIDNYINSLGYNSTWEIIKDNNLKFYEEYSKGNFDVLEAIAPGVVLTPLTKSANADYIGVIRPKISNLNKFKALLLATKHYGKDYDYHLDFRTDSELVCSELTYKAYRSFINISLSSTAGREIFTATDFVKKLDREQETNNNELEFVYFIDASEEKSTSFINDLESFRKSWERPKWDIKQQ